MKYTDYFSDKIRREGVPQLSETQFRRFMNIVYLEGKLSTIKGFDEKLSMKAVSIEIAISKLSKGLNPYDLLREMKTLSKKK